MKICLVLPSHWTAFKGGAELQADMFAKHAAATGRHQVTYLTRAAAAAERDQAYVLRRISPRPSSPRWGLWAHAAALYRALSDIDPDVLLQHVGCAYTGIAAAFGRRRGVPLVWYAASDIDVERAGPARGLRGLPAAIDRRLRDFGIRHAATVVTQTRAQARRLAENFGREADHVIANFHEPHPAAIRKPGGFTVLWVSNLKPLKRPELFVRLARECAADVPIRFRMIGRPQRSRWCEDLLKEAAGVAGLEYLGELDLDGVNRELEHAHLLLNTSEYEGFPNAFIQAWLREVPTASLCVDPDQVITAAGLGAVTGTYEGLKRYVLALARDPAERARIGTRARRFAERHYSMDNADRLLAVVEATAATRCGYSAAVAPSR